MTVAQSICVFYPASHQIIEEALKFAKVNERDVFYDPACGDGRALIRAVQEPFNAKRAVGIEIEDYLAKISSDHIRGLSLQHKIDVINKSLFDVNLSEADVLYAFLRKTALDSIRPKLERELIPETRVVSLMEEFDGWKLSDFKDVKAPLGFNGGYVCKQRLFLYRMGEI